MPTQQISPEMERIVSLDQEVEVLGSGYQVGEGPLWWSEDGVPAVQRSQGQPPVEMVCR